MKTIDNIWIAEGLPLDDPNCLKDIDEMTDYVNKVGFLPLMKNSIPGFSVEEHAANTEWWTDSKADPWMWRTIAAQEKKLAYGKFFNQKAGFISKAWLPVFASYRRKGYDFDSLYDDGHATHRMKLIMDCFETTNDLPSRTLKDTAGFGTNKEKGFESTMTRLQMQTYLTVSKFKKKLNKAGEEYGWALAIYSTPESTFGDELVRSMYDIPPDKGYEQIISHLKSLYTISDEKKMRKEIL